MLTESKTPTLYDEHYYEDGINRGLSCYENYRWIPEQTIPLCAYLCERLNIERGATILDFGCAKGYMVKAFRLLGREAYGWDISDYALQFCTHVAWPFGVTVDWIIAKDVLEHLPEDQINWQLSNFNCKHIFISVPLAENGKYLDPRDEKDITHVIREPLAWWVETVRKHFRVLQHASTEFGPLKANSKPNSQGFIWAYK